MSTSKRKPYKLSPRAKKQLDNILIYTIENWSEKQADAYSSLLEKSFQFIDDHFEAGRITRYTKKEIRLHFAGEHYILYERHKDGFTYILEIVHRKRNINFFDR